MIFRLLLLIALPFAAWYVAKAISRRYSFNARQNRYLFVVMAALLLVGALIMLGKLPVHWILAPLGAIGAFLLRMLPAALRLLPLWQILGSRIASGATTPRKTSSLRTEYLDVALDHASGELEGTVLLGQFSGRKLSSMALPELLQLREECEHDADSRQVLEAYLDRNHPGWHGDAEGRENSADSAGETAMTRQLALEILGLEEGASRDEINSAHRRLMQKFHPDRGGSDYFSKKLNTARDLLLEDDA